MKNLNLFLLTVGMLIWSSCSYINSGATGFSVVGPFTTSAFKCIRVSIPDTAHYAVIRAYQNSQSPAGIDTNALQTITNALAAGYNVDAYVEICRGINATSQINLVNTDIMIPAHTNPANHNRMIAIKVEPSSNPTCSWAGHTAIDNCNFLTEAVNAVTHLGWFPSVFSTANIWKQFFGSSCDTFATATGAAVWYAKYDNTGHVTSSNTFDDFVPFGGWALSGRKVTIKQISGNLTVPLLCGSTAWHAFVDLISFV